MTSHNVLGREVAMPIEIRSASAFTASYAVPARAAQQLIEQLLGHYTNIVVDSPPILGLADAPLLARSVEGSIMVIEAEGVAARGVKSALARLQSVHAHIFGVVMTKLKDRHAGHSYGYGYGYSYGSDKKD